MKNCKRILAYFIIGAMMVFMLMPTMASAVDGTIIEISSAEDLRQLAVNVNNGETYEGETVILKKDIALSGEWLPIGNGARSGSGYTGNAFKGVFNGNGKTVSGLTIKTNPQNTDAGMGLFGVLDGGTVKALKLSEVDIALSDSECAGAAVGLMVNGAAVEEVTVDGSVSAKRGNGGIVGRMTVSGTISNCVNNAGITAQGANVGGIVGAAYYTGHGGSMYITRCKNNGEIVGYGGAAGGIAGLSAAYAENCSNTAAVTGSGASIGGIIGEQQNYGGVAGCENSGNVINNDSAAYGTGGIVGWIRYSGADSSYPVKAIIRIEKNANSGNIIGGNDGGGIAGTLYNAGVVWGNENMAAAISGSNFAAGIIGNIQDNETPTGIEKTDFHVYNNVSATAMGNISGNYTDAYGYNNPDPGNDKGFVRDNADKWAAQVGNDRFTTVKAAIEAAAEGDTVVILSIDPDGQINIDKSNVEIENKTGNAITVNGKTIGPDKIFHAAITEVGAVKATCTEDGNIEYWYCSRCNKYFSDEACSNEITEAQTVVKAAGHQFADGVCEICGEKYPGDPGTVSDNSVADSELKTGDDFNMALPVILAVAALIAIAVLVMTRRKK